MAKSRTPRRDILAQIPAARAREQRERRAGRRATSAHYDPANRLVMLRLTSGVFFGFPVAAIPELSKASDAELAMVVLSPGGSALHWEVLDADLSIPGLIMSVLGADERRTELARLAGRSTSRAKAAAARANGAKGGRPRKKAVVKPR
jgi:hypothetical protein